MCLTALHVIHFSREIKCAASRGFSLLKILICINTHTHISYTYVNTGTYNAEKILLLQGPVQHILTELKKEAYLIIGVREHYEKHP